MNALSLFSGIGGIDLGLTRVGMTIVGQVEIDPYCQRVLAKHWPEVPRHDDVRTAADWWLSGDARPVVDLICAGFPCQPSSVAGRRRGDQDDRWLWPATIATIRALRPEWVILENPPGLLTVRLSGEQDLDGHPVDAVGIGVVLRDLAESGYGAQWDCVPASAVGAPHRRDRWWCVARLADTSSERRGERWTGRPAGGDQDGPDVASTGLANTDRAGLDPWGWLDRPWPTPVRDGWWQAESCVDRDHDGLPARLDGDLTQEPWERGIPRLTTGVPDQAARLHALGNAVVPQVAEHIGRIVMAYAACADQHPSGPHYTPAELGWFR
ncbi:DNA cytosine methyltransferase [Frankia sp. Cj3]|uniref:DNA cytosine methyltransferase n=1 Tax=Frankia sp. Cj3 TaxID=2880976 RepID=UPI001EF5CDE0|nr:DNA cytosine methyltransferase [Frankia sp. Cj3]